MTLPLFYQSPLGQQQTGNSFYFAWVNSNETTFNESSHAVWDEDVFSFDVEHSEGEFPALNLTIRNPKVGLLAPGRKVWGWLSQRIEGNSPEITPLFFGRLVGIPDNVFAELVTLKFIAKPSDYNTQKNTLANSLRVFPYYDPIFIDESYRDDPDTVLEGYSRFWHIDRTTHVVTTSDIITGEDGTIQFTENDILYGTVELSIGEVPLRQVKVIAEVNWVQRYTGIITLNPGAFNTLAGQVLVDGWPSVGTDLGSGWKVASASINDYFAARDIEMNSGSFSWQNSEDEHQNGDTLSLNISWSYPQSVIKRDAFQIGNEVQYKPDKSIILKEEIVDSFTQSGLVAAFSEPPRTMPEILRISYRWTVFYFLNTSLSVQYNAARNRKEVVTFTLNADFQPILTDVSDDQNFEEISVNGADVDTNVEGSMPIGYVHRRAYFPIPRGLNSIEYLIAIARAKLLSRSRVVEISFECNYYKAVELSCRNNVLVLDDRLPGGQALGKVTSYGFGVDGSSGRLKGQATIMCAVGYGNAISTSTGDPLYVETGYVEIGYQQYENVIVALAAGDTAYAPPIEVANDDGLTFPLTRAQAVVSEEKVINDTVEPTEGDEAPSKVSGTFYRVTLRPVTNGPFENEYAIIVSDLVMPKQIDLEAAA